MASFTSLPNSQSFLNKPIWEYHPHSPIPRPAFLSFSIITNPKFPSNKVLIMSKPAVQTPRGVAGNTLPPSGAAVIVAASTTAEKPKKRNEAKGFVDEMKLVSVKLHTKDQAKGGEKEAPPAPVKWEPSIEGYLRFLVDSKMVYDTFEGIVEKATFPFYSEFRNTGLERSESLAKDLKWFEQQGHTIPEPSPPGCSYSLYLKELSEKDPQAFLCHYYNFYLAHTAGGRMIGKKVAEMILDKKVLEFYKWDGNLAELIQNVKEKLNEVAEGWTRKEKDRCLEETEKSFKYSGDILRLIAS